MSKKLIRGKFYIHNDENGGHPALIFEKNFKKNKYKAVKFTTKNGKRRTRLKHNINGNDDEPSYVHNYPVESKRYMFSSKELKGLKVHKDDKPLINKIKRKRKK